MAIAVVPSRTEAGKMPAYPCPTPGCPKQVLVRAVAWGGGADVEVKCAGCKQLVIVTVR